MFKKENLTVPNLLSISRILFIPLLIYFANKDMRLTFMIAYLLVAITDLFDGLIARKFNQTTEIGKTLDATSDLFFYLSTAYYVFKLYPQHYLQNVHLLYILVALIALSFIISWFRFKTILMMHTLLLKLPAGLLFFYVLFSYFYDTPLSMSFILGVYIIAFIEVNIIFIRYRNFDQDSKSMFHIREKV
jgi:phosphatidylglycerophosphate synthase